MSNLRVKVRSLDENTLSSHKKVNISSSRSFETPLKAIPIKNTSKKDRISTKARGFNEIYLKVDPSKLTDSKVEVKSSLKDNIRNSLNKAKKEEFNTIFISYEAIEPISEENIFYLADFIYSTSDFLTIPIMSKMREAIKKERRGIASKSFQRYLDQVEKFIEIYRQIDNKPILGVLPPLPWKFSRKIVDLYINREIRAFCFNFDGRTVTAEKQLLDMVTPLMRRVGMDNLREEVIFYSLNAHRGRKIQTIEGTPARDFISFGFGFDVLGDKHVSGNLPPSVYEKKKDQEPEFRIFDKREYIYNSYKYGSDLAKGIPDDTGLDKERILGNTDPYYRNRLSNLLIAEQQSKESNQLRPIIDEYRVLEHITEKEGVTEENLNDMKKTRKSFENEKMQTSLDELSDLL